MCCHQRLVISLLFLSGSFLVYSQQAVTPAYEHFNKFNTVNGGWLASDATISLLLPDSNTLWLFGDCIIGEESAPFVVNGDKSTFINNSAIIEDDGVLTAYYQGSQENPSSLKEVVFVLFDSRSYEAYSSTLEEVAYPE